MNGFLKRLIEVRGELIAIAHPSDPLNAHADSFVIIRTQSAGIVHFESFLVYQLTGTPLGCSLTQETAMRDVNDEFGEAIKWCILKDYRLKLSGREKPSTHKGLSID